MKMRTTLLTCAALTTLTFASTGCTSSGTDSTSSSPAESSTETPHSSSAPTPSRPTLTNPKLQPPTQDKYISKDHPAIVFDPCTWISDDTVRKSGFDPSTRKRGDDQIAEHSFLTCDFGDGNQIDGTTLMINSGNATWDEDITKVHDYSEPTTINGREAMWVRNPKVTDECQIDLRTKAGFVQVVVASNSIQSTERPCGNLENIASNIESEIGKDN